LLPVGIAFCVIEIIIFITNIIIYYILKADEKRKRLERREARKLKTISSQIHAGTAEDKDLGEFVFKMFDTAKIAPSVVTC
jgi:predicted RND superfamily exporter protein